MSSSNLELGLGRELELMKPQPVLSVSAQRSQLSSALTSGGDTKEGNNLL